MSQDLIQLNVGGVLYTTTKSTMSLYPDSMLGAMFNETMPTTLDENGRYFIDRNGQMFSYILDFLRSSQLALPDDFKHYAQLAMEADFYQIKPLIEAVSNARPTVHQPEELPCHLVEVTGVQNKSYPDTTWSTFKTVVSGPEDVISLLPQELVGDMQKQSGKKEFIQVSAPDEISNVRLRLAEYFLNNGWKKFDTSVSLSTPANNFVMQTFSDWWMKKRPQTLV